MSSNDPIKEFIHYGFENYGEGFGIILFGTAILINSRFCPWISETQKKEVKGYYEAISESRPPTEDEKFFHMKALTSKVGIFFVALGIFFIIFN